MTSPTTPHTAFHNWIQDELLTYNADQTHANSPPDTSAEQAAHAFATTVTSGTNAYTARTTCPLTVPNHLCEQIETMRRTLPTTTDTH